jgi:LysR family transcriptional activator of nhaA
MKINLGNRQVYINYHHLYCFYIVSTEGSLGLAGKKLGVGTSALSIQIKQFEESLGTALFSRTHKKLELNDDGQLILSYAKEIFKLGSEMIESLNDRPSPHLIHLQIGALDTIPKHLTTQLVKEAVKFKNCTVTVVEGKPAELLHSLTQHRIDLLLTNSPPQFGGPKLFGRRIARLPLWIVGGKKFIGLKKDFPKSIHQQPHILPTGDSSVRQEFENFSKTNGIEPYCLIESQDVMVQKLLAVDEIGLTVVPEFAVRDYVRSKSLHLIGKLPDSFEDLYIVTSSRRIENPVAAQLMKTFKVH